jgi:hypothetical protein
MAQSVMTGVIDGTFAGYGLKFAPDSEMPVIRDFRAKSIWLSELVELGKSDTPRFYARSFRRFGNSRNVEVSLRDSF